MSVPWAAYRMFAPMLGAAAPLGRLLAPERERALWGERLGHVAGGSPVEAWIHAASLGEALAVKPLVLALKASSPDARVHLTANTLAGRARLCELGEPCSLAPLDSPQAVARFLKGVRPRRLFLIETELWPHWLLSARALGLPVAVLSARLSLRSLEGYARLGGRFRDLVAGLEGVLCQSLADEERWRELGSRAERTAVVGNLKDDALPEPAPDRAEVLRARGLDPRRPLLVLGSLRPGEVLMLARAWRGLAASLRAEWQVVAVPRHPRAAAGLRAEAGGEGQALIEAGSPIDGAWRWDERLGVLGGYYAAADVAVVGGTLAPYGGHNPLEPAACGAAVIIGPHHWAQADGVAALLASGGGRLAADAASLTEALDLWLGDRAKREAAQGAVLRVVRSRRGAARRAVERLEGWGLWPAA